MNRIEEDRLIQNARTLPVFRRTFWGFITAVFWVVYVYLWLPLITLAMWFFGVRQARLELYLRTHSFDTYLLVVLPVIAVLTGLALVAWAEYNRRRFREGDRRATTPPVGHGAIVCDLGGTEIIARALASHQVCVLQMNDDAVPIGVSALNVGGFKPASVEERLLPLNYRHAERAEHEPPSLQQSEPQTGTLFARKL